MLSLAFILITSFVISSKFSNDVTTIENSISNDSITSIDTTTIKETISKPDTIEIYDKETKKHIKYIKVIKYELTENTQEETFVFTEGNEYIIGSNSYDIFVYFYTQDNTDTKKNMNLKFIGNGNSISYLCKKTEVHHIKFRVVSNKDKKDPYEGIVYFVVPEK
jgi:hypothetical protein